MTIRRRLTLGALAASLSVSTAAAQHNPLYIGLNAGAMNADAGGFDNARNIGLLLGYTLFRDAAGALSLESEYTRNLSKGDLTVGGTSGHWKIETLSAHAAYRTEGPTFLKAKLGGARADVRAGVPGTTLAGRDSGFSFGAGVGWRFTRKTGLELEYTVLGNDVSFLSLGYFTHL